MISLQEFINRTKQTKNMYDVKKIASAFYDIMIELNELQRKGFGHFNLRTDEIMVNEDTGEATIGDIEKMMEEARSLEVSKESEYRKCWKDKCFHFPVHRISKDNDFINFLVYNSLSYYIYPYSCVLLNEDIYKDFIQNFPIKDDSGLPPLVNRSRNIYKKPSLEFISEQYKIPFDDRKQFEILNLLPDNLRRELKGKINSDLIKFQLDIMNKKRKISGGFEYTYDTFVIDCLKNVQKYSLSIALIEFYSLIEMLGNKDLNEILFELIDKLFIVDPFYQTDFDSITKDYRTFVQVLNKVFPDSYFKRITGSDFGEVMSKMSKRLTTMPKMAGGKRIKSKRNTKSRKSTRKSTRKFTRKTQKSRRKSVKSRKSRSNKSKKHNQKRIVRKMKKRNRK